MSEYKFNRHTHVTENARTWHMERVNYLENFKVRFEEVLQMITEHKIDKRTVKKELRKIDKELTQRRLALSKYEEQLRDK